MEIHYKRSYVPPRRRRYTAGEIPVMLGYAMEIADPRAVLCEGKLEPGETCLLLFGITPEEYAWRNADAKRLDALAEQLKRTVPADRLIAWSVCDLKGARVQRSVRPQTGASIDGGAFAAALRQHGAGEAGPLDRELLDCRRLQLLCAQKDAPEDARAEWSAARHSLGAALPQLDCIYVAEEALLDGKWPYVGPGGRVELFTLEARARNVQARVTEANANVELWRLRKLSGAEIEAYLRRCGGNGLRAFRVDNGFCSVEIALEDILADVQVQNANLRAMLIREIACGVRWKRLKEAEAPEQNLRGLLEGMLSMRNFAWRELGRGKLCALCADENLQNCAFISGQPNGERMLAVFTDKLRAAAFAERMAGNSHVVELSFDELAKRAAAAGGMVIDAGEMGYCLPKSAFDRVRELREGPPLAVRIQPPQAKGDGEARAAAEVPRMGAGELPDPDKVALPATEASKVARAKDGAPCADEGGLPDAEEAVPPAAGSAGQAREKDGAQRTPQPKKNIFKRLFGK